MERSALPAVSATQDAGTSQPALPLQTPAPKGTAVDRRQFLFSGAGMAGALLPSTS